MSETRESETIEPEFDDEGFAIVWISTDVYTVYSNFKLKNVTVLSNTVKQIEVFSDKKCSKSTKHYDNATVTVLTKVVE
jgi:hypothetical protein